MFSYPRSMWLISSISLVPSAIKAATTMAAPARRSLARRGAGIRWSTPSMTATWPSTPGCWPPILRSSST